MKIFAKILYFMLTSSITLVFGTEVKDKNVKSAGIAENLENNTDY